MCPPRRCDFLPHLTGMTASKNVWFSGFLALTSSTVQREKFLWENKHSKKKKMEVITWMGVWVVWIMTVIILLSTVHTGCVWAVTCLFNHTATTTVWLNKQTNRLRHFIVELLIMYALFLMEKYIIFKLFYCSLCLRRSQCNRTMSSPQIFLGSLWSLAAK